MWHYIDFLCVTLRPRHIYWRGATDNAVVLLGKTLCECRFYLLPYLQRQD